MKVTGLRTHPYKVKMQRAIADANDPIGMDEMAFLAVFLESDEGRTGHALSSPGAEAAMHSMVEALIIGQDPRAVQGLWKKMVDYVFKGGQVGTANAALSAIDAALWDLKARLNDEPLWKTLGATEPRVRAYASGIDMCLSDEELYRCYADFAKRGVFVGKLKVGLDREADLRRIGIMQEALAESGKRPRLLIDANEYWSAKQAMQNISYFEKRFDIFWVEEPARRWDYKALRKVSKSVKAAVATGENLQQLSDYTLLIENEAVDIVQCGLGAGGVTGTLKVADLAYAFDLPFSLMNSPGNYTAPVAAAMPNHIMKEVLEVGLDKGLKLDSYIEDGWIVLGDKPGFGLEFDEAEMAAMEKAYRNTPAQQLPRLWGRRQGAGLLEVAPEE
jgi:L-alanine-DL-glutamate epimerase-like enolase superfamily enzyme